MVLYGLGVIMKQEILETVLKIEDLLQAQQQAVVQLGKMYLWEVMGVVL